MAEPDDLFLARQCVERGLLARPKLREILFELARERREKPDADPRTLGAVLVARGVFDEDKLRKALSRRVPLPGAGGPVSPELEVGHLLVMAGAATSAQVNVWLKQPQMRLTQFLFERGFTTPRLLARALTYHRKAVFVCINCKKRLTILNPQPDGEYTCTKCGSELTPASPEPATGETKMVRIPAAEPAAGADASIDRLMQADRVFCVHAEGKGMMTRDALREALRVQTDLMRFGETVALPTVASQLGLLGQEAQRRLERIDFADQINTPEWHRQAVPGLTLLNRIAIGGDAFVAEAAPLREERVLVKVMHTDRARDAAAVKRFDRDASTFSKVSHQSLVKAVDAGTMVTRQGGEVPYAVLEHMPGVESLEQLLAIRGSLPAGIALRVAADLAEGLAFLKSKGRIHGDLRAEHVLVDAKGRAKLFDLGRLTTYSDVGGAADLESLGRLLYAMLSGRPAPAGAVSVDGVQAPGWALAVAARLVGPETERIKSLEELTAALAPYAPATRDERPEAKDQSVK